MNDTIYITDRDLLRGSLYLLFAGVTILLFLLAMNGWLFFESSISHLIADLVQLFIHDHPIREDNLPNFFAG